MAQINPEPSYDHLMIDRVVAYLQTKDPRLFPFTARFDDEQRRAFIRDLRDGLAELTDSGSARKTSATGYIVSDSRLAEIIREWAAAGGGWPRGSDPRDPTTALLPVPDENDGVEDAGDSRQASGVRDEVMGDG